VILDEIEKDMKKTEEISNIPELELIEASKLFIRFKILHESNGISPEY